MMLGADNSKKTYLAVGLFVVAVIMVVRFIASETGGSSPAAASTTAAAAPQPTRTARRTPARSAARNKADKTAAPVTPQLDPRLNLAALNQAEDTKYDGTGRNIFMATEEPKIEKPQGPGLLDGKNQKPQPPTPPVTPQRAGPPPINLKFFGFASGPDHKRVFLSSGDEVVVASEGDIVQRRYKIMKINDKSIDVLDVLSNNRQTIPLTAG